MEQRITTRLPSANTEHCLIEIIRLPRNRHAYRVTLDGRFVGLYFSREALASALDHETERAA